MVIRLYASALVALVLALTGSLAAATVVAGVVRLVPTQDTTIYSESGDLGNGAGEFVFSGRTSLSSSRRALLGFDVAGNVPAGATIKSATLTLHVSQSPGASQPPPSAAAKTREKPQKPWRNR